MAMWGGTGDQGVAESLLVSQAVHNMWYNGEINAWPESNYGSPNPNLDDFGDFGHMTQVIWAGTNKLGCFTKLCPAGSMNDGLDVWYTVCDYGPPGKRTPTRALERGRWANLGFLGNVGGAYATNVLRPVGAATIVAK